MELVYLHLCAAADYFQVFYKCWTSSYICRHSLFMALDDLCSLFTLGPPFLGGSWCDGRLQEVCRQYFIHSYLSFFDWGSYLDVVFMFFTNFYERLVTFLSAAALKIFKGILFFFTGWRTVPFVIMWFDCVVPLMSSAAHMRLVLRMVNIMLQVVRHVKTFGKQRQILITPLQP